MDNKFDFRGAFVLCLATAIVTLAAVSLILYGFFGGREGLDFILKVNTVREVVEERYVGDMNWQEAADKAAAGIVEASGDRWSYYMTAEEYSAYTERSENSTKGIGVTVQLDEEGRGALIISVEASSPAERAGLKPGCILTHIGETSLAGLDMDAIKQLIRANTGEYDIGFLDANGISCTSRITNELIYISPVSAMMLDENTAYILIENFEKGAAADSVAELDKLISQGTENVIWDVRYNGGGRLSELTELLDHLLPEGEIFVSVSADGEEEISYSDASCVDMPMVVLINEHSYSAAEFFAAALREYEVATLIGSPSTGKARSQQTFMLDDGSAVHISTRNYLTPARVSLAEQGGLVPDIEIAPEGESDVQLEKALEYLS